MKRTDEVKLLKFIHFTFRDFLPGSSAVSCVFLGIKLCCENHSALSWSVLLWLCRTFSSCSRKTRSTLKDEAVGPSMCSPLHTAGRSHGAGGPGYLVEMGAMCKQPGCRSDGWPSFLCWLGSQPSTTPPVHTQIYHHPAVTRTERAIKALWWKREKWRVGSWWGFWAWLRAACRTCLCSNTLASGSRCKNHSELGYERTTGRIWGKRERRKKEKSQTLLNGYFRKDLYQG